MTSLQILKFLLDTFFFVLMAAALLRAWMNQQRIQMSGQPGQFAIAVTNWLVAPLRRLLPKAVANSRIDWGSITAAMLLALAYATVWLLLLSAFQGALSAQFAWLAELPFVAGKFLIRVCLQGLMVLLLVYAVLSWVKPDAPSMGTLDRLCAPLLRPVRRVIPTIGGVDLSVLLMLVLLQVGLIALV